MNEAKPTPRETTALYDLEWLLSPTTAEGFVSSYWNRDALRITRNDPDFYSSLMSEADLEFMLLAASGSRGTVEELLAEEQSKPCRNHAAAIEAFRSGKSLRIAGIHKFSGPLLRLSRQLTRSLNCITQINMYLSPGGGKALPMHFDTHDVFVLQISGRKRWSLFDSPVPYPLEFLPLLRHEKLDDMKKFRLQKDASGKTSCEMTSEFTLESGDLLYLPRGHWHQAQSEPGSTSCHLTVGLQSATYNDLLSLAIGQVALTDARLREPLPLGFGTDDAAAQSIEQHILEILAALPGSIRTRQAVAEMSRGISRHASSSLDNSILQSATTTSAPEVTLDTCVQLREGVFCTLDRSTSPMQLTFGSKAFAIAEGYEQACGLLSEELPFCVKSIQGSLSDEAKLGFVSQLLGEGLLKISAAVPSTKPGLNSAHWLPVTMNVAHHTVQWLDFGMRPLRDPFFRQSVKRLERSRSAVPCRTTPAVYLQNIAEEMPPSGFIFHISRCGSTLLSNALRAIDGTTVISEAQPISAALGLPTDSTGSAFERDTALQGLLRAYGRRRTGHEASLLVKFTSWNILHLQVFRRLWPETPCVIVVRDPLEVAVSCLDGRPGWMRQESHIQGLEQLFADFHDATGPEGAERLCAQVLGEFCTSAAKQIDSRCQVVCYEDLDPSSCERIATTFGIDVRSKDRSAMKEVFRVDAKHPGRLFIKDGTSKRERATPSLRHHIEAFAREPYSKLLMLSEPPALASSPLRSMA